MVINKKEAIPSLYGINLITKDDSTKALFENKGFDDITYDNIKIKSDPEGQNQDISSIPAGAYIYDCAGKKWHYYKKMNISGGRNYTARISKNSEAPCPSPLFKCPDDKHSFPYLTIDGKTKVKEDILIAAVDDLSRVLNSAASNGHNNNGTVNNKNKFTIDYFSVSSQLSPVINFSAPSAILDIDADKAVIQGSLSGSGKLISNGTLYIEGGSYFETVQNSGVGIFAQNSVNIISAAGSYGKELNELIQSAWDELYSSTHGIIYDQLIDGEMVSAMDLAVEMLRNNKGLISYLESNGCTGGKQTKFLESIIAKNSSYLAEGSSSITGTPVNINCSDTFTLFTDQGTGLGLFNSGPYSMGSNLKNTDFIDWHTLGEEIGSNNSSNLPNERFSFATALTEPNKDYPKNGLNLPNGMYMVFWVHDKQENPMPSTCIPGFANDLFVCIPKDDMNRPVEIRYSKGTSVTLSPFPGQHDSLVGNIGESRFFSAQITGEARKYFIFNEETDITTYLNEYPDEDSDENFDSNIRFTINMEKVVAALKSSNQELTEDGSSPLDELRDAFQKNKSCNWMDTVTIGLVRKKISEPFARHAVYFRQYEDMVVSSESGLTLKQGDIVKPTKNDTTIKGMIFCREGNFNTSLETGSLTVMGGVITYKKGLDLIGGPTNICYDPDYMGFLAGVKGCILGYCYQKIY